MMYDDLIKKLRYCGNAISCIHCPYWEGCEGSKEDLIKAADAIEELRKAVLRLEDESGIYDELPTVYIYPTKWIPVTERLPDTDVDVLVMVHWRDYPEDMMCYGRRFKTRWYLWNGELGELIKGFDITHWMPLPEPPKDGE